MPREVSHFLIGAVYHPPKANNIDMSHYLMDILDTVNKTHSNLGIILLGDFNQLPDSQLKSCPLSQLVTFPTRGSAILDKIFTNIKPWYQPPLVIPAVGRSDHDTVLLHPIAEPKQPRRNKQTTYWRSSDPNGKAMIYHHLQHFNWSSLFRMDSCQTMVQYFYSVIISLLDQYLPLIPRSTYSCDKPWVTAEFRQLIKRRQRAFLLGQHSLYKKLRNKSKRTAASLRKKYYEKKIHSLHSLDPHSWWTKTKQFLHSTTPNPLVGLQEYQSDAPIAELINDFFVSISGCLPSFDPNQTSELENPHIPDFVIDPSEVDLRLANIKIHKAPGPDGIPNWLLRDFSGLLCQPLAAIFNASLREGFFPPIWKAAEVIPIPKVHPPTSIQNDLRLISLLPTAAKVFEGFVWDWLTPYLEPYLDNNQFGCRPERSTTHALISVLHKWMATLDNKGSVRAVFVDFRKAFDLVNHNILFRKLQNFNIPNCLLKWLGSYLSQRCQRVRVGSFVSSWKALRGGMPQGSRLGPLSFIVIIDDLATHCGLDKFVDDTTLSELLPPSASVSNMPLYFESILTWTVNNDMQINISKTKEIILGRISQDNLELLSTPAGTVERVTTFKLLGIHLDDTLTWSTHVNAITSKATKRLYFLKQLTRAGVPCQELLHFYTAVIRPVLEYAAPVWHYAITQAQTQQLESVQKRAIHIIWYSTRGLSYHNALLAVNLPSLQARREELSNSFFREICNPNSCLNYLLPPKRDTSVTSRLRAATPYPRPTLRTKKYCSFINYGLSHYQ